MSGTEFAHSEFMNNQLLKSLIVACLFSTTLLARERILTPENIPDVGDQVSITCTVENGKHKTHLLFITERKLLGSDEKLTAKYSYTYYDGMKDQTGHLRIDNFGVYYLPLAGKHISFRQSSSATGLRIDPSRTEANARYYGSYVGGFLKAHCDIAANQPAGQE